MYSVQHTETDRQTYGTCMPTTWKFTPPTHLDTYDMTYLYRHQGHLNSLAKALKSVHFHTVLRYEFKANRLISRIVVAQNSPEYKIQGGLPWAVVNTESCSYAATSSDAVMPLATNAL